jgi:DNA end-binding protein Ku
VPRAIWSGSISFGLVNVPVRVYSAIEEHKLHFHFVHEKDNSPIGYQKICKKEEKPVPDKEIVKAFEYEKGEYVFMGEEDFAAAKVEGYKSIDITDFVLYADIDPIFFAKTYYVGPDQGAEKVYSLLVKAMEDSELAAIAKFVMRDQQHLGALRVRDGVVTLEQLYFADEIRPIDEIKASKGRVGKQELQMAAQLIESWTSEWKPKKYKDTYRDELCAVIKAKRKGDEVHRAAEVEEDEPVDLLDALRASIERSRGKSRSRGRRTAPTTSSGNGRRDLSELSKADLDKRAKQPDRGPLQDDEGSTRARTRARRITAAPRLRAGAPLSLAPK